VRGLLVADASLKPLFANNEADATLTYPEASLRSLGDVFHQKVRPGLFSAKGSLLDRNGARAILKLKSGRRTYFCRAYLLKSNGKGWTDAATLLVLERETSGRLILSQVSQQFHLTHREQQTVALLLQGLSNKQIADKMGISLHTVKAFLHMAAVKLGASGRSGIVTKILGSLLSSIHS